MKRLLSILSAITVLGFPAIAHAQFSLNNADSIILNADDASTSNGLIVLTGQADIRQGDVRLLADKVQIFTDGSEGGLVSTSGFSRMIATGNFYYITPEQEVRGDKAVYTQTDDSFVVTGDVVLLQEDSVVTGGRLNYNLTTREAKIIGDCNGRKCGKGQRVSILIRNSGAAQGVN